MRYVIVHYHIFKNGGSTIESILRREFGSGFARLHGPAPESVLGPRDVGAFLRRHPEVSAISSHHLRYPLPDAPGVVIFDCCFLRHPLARLQSLYSYLQGLSCSMDPLCCLAQRESPRTFLRWLADNAPHIVSNIQVTQLANQGAFNRPASRADLRRALDLLPQMSIPGLVEDYDESLAVAEFYLRPAFPDLALHYVPKNVTSPPEWRGLPPEEYLRDVWGSDLYQAMAHLNRLDIELFEGVREELAIRCAQIPRFPERLDAFRSRCSQRLVGQGERRFPAVVCGGRSS